MRTVTKVTNEGDKITLCILCVVNLRYYYLEFLSNIFIYSFQMSYTYTFRSHLSTIILFGFE